ncbi:MAG: hypothetical protein AB7S81_03840 [Bdellovibrionales bacterium]
MAKGIKTGGRRAGTFNKATAELKELARPYAPEALETLRLIMRDSESDAARVSAAKEILDRSYGKTCQPLSGPDETPLVPKKEVDIVDVARRIAFILDSANIKLAERERQESSFLKSVSVKGD